MIVRVVVGCVLLGFAAGLFLSGVLDHLEWRLDQAARRRRASGRRGFVDVRRSVR